MRDYYTKPLINQSPPYTLETLGEEVLPSDKGPKISLATAKASPEIKEFGGWHESSWLGSCISGSVLGKYVEESF